MTHLTINLINKTNEERKEFEKISQMSSQKVSAKFKFARSGCKEFNEQIDRVEKLQKRFKDSQKKNCPIKKIIILK